MERDAIPVPQGSGNTAPDEQTRYYAEPEVYGLRVGAVPQRDVAGHWDKEDDQRR